MLRLTDLSFTENLTN